MARSRADSRSPAARRPSLAAALVAAALVAGCNAFPNPPPPRGFDGPTQVTVEPGEDLRTVARRWNVPVEEVARMNGLQPPYSVAPGTVLTLPRPRLHVVQEADSLLTISQQYGVDVAALARANNIAEPYAIYVGETLRLPSDSDMAFAGMPGGPGVAGPSAGPRSIAGPGAISRGAPLSATVESAPLDELPAQSSTPPAALATGPETSSAVGLPGGLPHERAAPAPGGLPAEGTLGTLPAPPPGAEEPTGRDSAGPAAGATVATAAGLETLPRPPARAPVPSTRSAPVAAPTVAEAPAAPAPAAAPTVAEAPAPPTSTETAAETAPAAQPAAAPAAPEPPPPTGPRFRWPVAGDVVSGFGPKADGSRNDGINVAAPRGTPVVAAQNGVVAYVGDEIESFGNLVLLRHADGWVTAYAHVDRVLVAADERVSIGQTIATVGTTGNVATPQLHFEIRRGTEPVDPSVYLTAR